jgi:hypothetical protein
LKTNKIRSAKDTRVYELSKIHAQLFGCFDLSYYATQLRHSAKLFEGDSQLAHDFGSRCRIISRDKRAEFCQVAPSLFADQQPGHRYR